MRASIAALASLLSLSACAVSQPFAGPGWDGELQSEATGPFLAAVTHTRAAPDHAKAFNDHVDAVVEQLDTQPGHIGHALRGRLPGKDRWTLTVWEDEESLVQFITSGAHMEAMTNGHVIAGVRSTTYEIEADELPPSWGDALDHLDEDAPEKPW